MNAERPWYAQGSDEAPAPPATAEEPKAMGGRWSLSRDWAAASWWIKGPFILGVALVIIGAKVGVHFGFEWLKARWHL